MTTNNGRTPVFAVIGVDHGHIYGMVKGLLGEGAQCAGWWSRGDTREAAAFGEAFPDWEKVDDRQQLLDDETVDVVLISAINAERADFALEAMAAGKDVMVDKPGCTSLDQFAALKSTVEKTGRIWSVCFSERLTVPSAVRADELIGEGAIGTVVQTIGTGPHQAKPDTRPAWFFDKNQFGGILCDICSHQIDQFLHYTRSSDAEVVASSTGKFGPVAADGFEDFGEVLLRSAHAQGYARVDWFTPDGLGVWGDGRMTILGTEGYIELRKYIDIAGRPGGDHLFLVNAEAPQHIDCSGGDIPYFRQFLGDVANRTETAMRQAHAFKAMELALTAQKNAVRVGR